MDLIDRFSQFNIISSEGTAKGSATTKAGINAIAGTEARIRASATTEAGINAIAGTEARIIAIAGTEARRITETTTGGTSTEATRITATTTGSTEATRITTETMTGGQGMATGTMTATSMTVLMSTASETWREIPEIALGWKTRISAINLVTNAPSHVMPVEAKVR